MYSAGHIPLAIGVTPNMVTAAGLLMSVIAGLPVSSAQALASGFACKSGTPQ